MTDPMLPNRARLAVSAMIDIARAGKPVPLREVSERTGISLSYLEQLVAALRLHKLLNAVQGRCGGYNLARPADSISIAEIVIAAGDWGPGLKKERSSVQPAHDPLWSHLHNIMLGQLRHVTLADAMIGTFISDN